ncbi:hypothetical protein CF327_g1776 [Tilletia walkeri]|uniref:Uncharacterized protein n=1 Tax=Tilletia walkeri TaxID=117179 RepID=A0A8X7N2P4_9BASI|nr:hypothetical protein CF327_g1776 [Tilletia walkeri]KAE8264278.1 hypothetical protein A4X09_0g7009 [Tilletia walkeri]
MVDSIVRAKAGRTYEIECQHPRMVPGGPDLKLTTIDYKMTLYTTEEPPQAGDVIHISGALIPTPEPFISASSFSVLFRGPLPDSFDPPCPTVVWVGSVVDVNEGEGWFRMRFVEYDRRKTARVPTQGIVEKMGRLWENAPAVRKDSIVVVRGTIKAVTDITSLFTITAEAIQFLPMSGGGAAGPSTPVKKRKYERKNLYNSSTQAAEDAEDDASIISPPPAAEVPTPSGKGKAKK